MKRIFRFIKNWMLIFAMICGIAGYFIYVNIPFLDPTHEIANKAIRILQPLLIFSMLFLTFCKINPKKLRLCKWHGYLLLFQTGVFVLLAVLLALMPHSGMRVVIEGTMLCIICPTATAAAVITKKLGGNAAHLTTYTILINLAVALIVPLMVPFVHPNPDMSIWSASLLILGKVFPLLLLPLIAAILIRYLLPRLHFILTHFQNLAFYLWAVALALACTVTVRSIVHSTESIATQLCLVVSSLVCCALQFYLGRRIGGRYNDRISGGQALGQKNTVLAIWMGFTFFTPVTAVVGGFYSIWHNIVNSWQLYEHQKQIESKNQSN